jgi:hypothetical protein
MVDHLELTRLDQLIFVLKILSTLFYKTSYFKEDISCIEPSPQLVFPARSSRLVQC